ncbi:MAG: hypothetical protein A4E47_01012 [Methanosaeta sp. PtaU1.Bin028]|nr:MAG: hypothetical protein A4E47_01012 [Methanosaeta sp. PtaU1.Bin028]
MTEATSATPCLTSFSPCLEPSERRRRPGIESAALSNAGQLSPARTRSGSWAAASICTSTSSPSARYSLLGGMSRKPSARARVVMEPLPLSTGWTVPLDRATASICLRLSERRGRPSLPRSTVEDLLWPRAAITAGAARRRKTVKAEVG